MPQNDRNRGRNQPSISQPQVSSGINFLNSMLPLAKIEPASQLIMYSIIGSFQTRSCQDNAFDNPCLFYLATNIMISLIIAYFTRGQVRHPFAFLLLPHALCALDLYRVMEIMRLFFIFFPICLICWHGRYNSLGTTFWIAGHLLNLSQMLPRISIIVNITMIIICSLEILYTNHSRQIEVTLNS